MRCLVGKLLFLLNFADCIDRRNTSQSFLAKSIMLSFFFFCCVCVYVCLRWRTNPKKTLEKQQYCMSASTEEEEKKKKDSFPLSQCQRQSQRKIKKKKRSLRVFYALIPS